ncbi:hypothetical protein LR48_Vigan475s001400 [Vigna angularis]|uniref:Uncharacterized protein n=1 Tax=Phaseolus angularis TaxID=3914 RepID=A0A0L9TBT5_PHAAN|nr:hypothetical protein LR48_Vigan475s001400 [Vigna angularis]
MRGKKKESYEKPHPHLKKNRRKEKKFKCLMEIFKKLEIKVPMIETLQQMVTGEDDDAGGGIPWGRRDECWLGGKDEDGVASKKGIVSVCLRSNVGGENEEGRDEDDRCWPWLSIWLVAVGEYG